MNQIYNLSQTISEDKETIAALENRLLNAKNILAAHEAAMERLTSVPSAIASVNKETSVTVGSTASESTSVNRERITMENCLELGMEVGDEVWVEVSGDDDFTGDTKWSIEQLDLGKGVSTFIRLTNGAYNSWYDYNSHDYENPIDKLYLIRTPEGSLNNQ